MLITKGLSEGSVATFKMYNGEEVIARLVRVEDDDYVIEKPLTLAMTPKGLAFQPWLITADVDRAVSLSKRVVTLAVPSAKESSDAYLQSTTGIVV